MLFNDWIHMWKVHVFSSKNRYLLPKIKNKAISNEFPFQFLWMESVKWRIKENWSASPKPAYISIRNIHFPHCLFENQDHIDMGKTDILMVVKEARLNISVKLIVVMPQVRENEHKNWYDVKASTDFEFFFEYNSLKLSLYMRIFSIFFLAKIQQQQQHHHHLVSAFRGLSALSILFLLLPMNSKWHYWGSKWLVCDILRKIFKSWMLLSFSICTLLFFGISMVFFFISISAHKCDYVFDSTSYETSTVTESNFIRLDSLCVCVNTLCVCVCVWRFD